jgi:23S rRNA (uracil1939-C5)-methyltransferase
MVSLALDLMDIQSTDILLDLFCGLGNFSLPMAKKCSKLIAVEGSAEMVERAKSNALLNGILNTEFFAANLDNPDALKPFQNRGIQKILIDPPRTGALEIVRQMDILKPERIVYVSCNPATLARDAGILVHEKAYRLSASAVMDMFPHTAHVESIALFEKG